MLFPKLKHSNKALALKFKGQALSYSELFERCHFYLHGLGSSGISPGDAVAVWTHPSLETMIAFISHALAGVISVPLNPAVGERELEHVIRDAAPKMILCLSHVLGEVTHKVPVLKTLSIGELLQAQGKSISKEAFSAKKHLLTLYTSGTTGAPKGAMITAGNIASNLDALIEAWNWTEKDQLVHALPLFHVHGLVLGLFGSLRVGSCFHWIEKFSPTAVAEAISEGGTMLFAVPTMYHRIAEAAEKDPSLGQALSKARLLVSGSAAFSAREHERMKRLTGQSIIERYGLTETLINCSSRWNGQRRPGHVGTPLKGVELRLVNDERKPISANDGQAIGEIAVRGPNVFAGYLNRPDATAQVMDAEGWFYTGDLATQDAQGFVKIVGRKATDLIKTGGYKVGAGEIEAALLEHPLVREVAVVGAPDEDLGEKIVAYVVSAGAHPSEQELIDFVARALAVHKRPRQVRFVSELPRNAMGKVMKGKLK